MKVGNCNDGNDDDNKDDDNIGDEFERLAQRLKQQPHTDKDIRRLSKISFTHAKNPLTIQKELFYLLNLSLPLSHCHRDNCQ